MQLLIFLNQDYFFSSKSNLLRVSSKKKTKTFEYMTVTRLPKKQVVFSHSLKNVMFSCQSDGGVCFLRVFMLTTHTPQT